ncbi:MAG: hypothetical protein HQ507_01730 [Candidatus Marinimicrobia bacterium]|nr:hypothetical protein [Candidatus Neomarinimicrobiota bacterium]
MKYALLFVSVLLIALTSCEESESLEAIAGVEGVVNFDAVWPDSIAGAVVVVFDVDLDLDSLNTSDYPVFDHFITYGDPIGRGVQNSDYFIQLEPGGYILMVIGLLIDPAQLLANEDLLQEIQKYIVVPENAAPRGIVIREKKINEQTDWYVHF